MFNFETDVKEMTLIQPSKRREGCEFIGMERNTQDGSVTFTFREKATGGTLAHREFVPSRLENQTDEEFKKNIQMNISRIAHIYRAFVTEAEFNAIKVDDPSNLAKAKDNWMAVTAMIGKNLKEKMANKAIDTNCALKVVYRKVKEKYYSSLPQVPPFISTSNHPKDFIWNPQYDILEQPTFVPDAAKATASQGGAPAGAAPSAFAGANTGGSPDF